MSRGKINKDDKYFHKTYEKQLMKLLKVVADFCCKELGVEYRSFAKMAPNDSIYKDCNAYCSPQFDIRIKLKCHKLGTYFNYKYLVDSVVHEIVHIYLDDLERHVDRFWNTHKFLFRKVKKVFNVA